VLGLELAWGDGSPPYVSFRAGNAWLSLFERRLMSEAINNSAKPFDAESQDKVAIILAVDDVDQTFHELKLKGVNFIMPPETRPSWGVRTAHLRDPDGNLIEINHRLSQHS